MPSRTVTLLPLLLLVACAATADPQEEGFGSARGPGVTLHKGAQVYLGSAGFCSRPATIDAAAVMAATPEWREIQRDGVREGSARHSLLRTAMHERIVAACKKAAQTQGNDLVVRNGDVADARGVAVADLTAAVVRVL